MILFFVCRLACFVCRSTWLSITPFFQSPNFLNIFFRCVPLHTSKIDLNTYAREGEVVNGWLSIEKEKDYFFEKIFFICFLFLGMIEHVYWIEIICNHLNINTLRFLKNDNWKEKCFLTFNLKSISEYTDKRGLLLYKVNHITNWNTDVW